MQRITEFLNEEEQVEYVEREPLPPPHNSRGSEGVGAESQEEGGHQASRHAAGSHHHDGAGILVQDATFAW
jgi:hypothetical protein